MKTTTTGTARPVAAMGCLGCALRRQVSRASLPSGLRAVEEGFVRAPASEQRRCALPLKVLQNSAPNHPLRWQRGKQEAFPGGGGVGVGEARRRLILGNVSCQTELGWNSKLQRHLRLSLAAPCWPDPRGDGAPCTELFSSASGQHAGSAPWVSAIPVGV